MAKETKPVVGSVMLSEVIGGEIDAFVIVRNHIHRYGDEQNVYRKSSRMAEAGTESSSGF